MADSENKTQQETKQDITPPGQDILLNIPEEKRDDYIAIDCEMAGDIRLFLQKNVESDEFNRDNSLLIRATLVDGHGRVVLDEYCLPTTKIWDMRYECHGIDEYDLFGKQSDTELIEKIQEIIKDKIIVGHSLKYDLEVLKVSPPESRIRDTAERFSWTFRKNIPSLKQLAKNKLGIEIQTDFHDSKEDALAALKIFVSFKSKFISVKNLGEGIRNLG